MSNLQCQGVRTEQIELVESQRQASFFVEPWNSTVSLESSALAMGDPVSQEGSSGGAWEGAVRKWEGLLRAQRHPLWGVVTLVIWRRVAERNI